MAWQLIERKSHRSGGISGLRCVIRSDKDRPRVFLTFGADMMASMKIKHGEHLNVCYDIQNMKLGFCKGTAETGFLVGGKCKSGSISFRVPVTAATKLLLNIEKQTLPFEMEGKMAVVHCKGPAAK